MDVYDFTPVQYPADDVMAEWQTTHFNFHDIDENVLKLDVLGHDDPTMIRKLQDLSGIDPNEIPMDDEGVMALFSGTDVLGVTPEQIGTDRPTRTNQVAPFIRTLYQHLGSQINHGKSIPKNRG